MKKRVLTALTKIGMIGLLPDVTRHWLACWYRFEQLPASRQQTLRQWSRDELIGTLLAHQLDPASGWLRTRFSPRQLEQRLRGHSRMVLLDEVGYSLPDPLPDPVPVGGSS